MAHNETQDACAHKVVQLQRINAGHLRSVDQVDSGLVQVFGGQLIGQSIHAATSTVDDWALSSCASQFLRRGRVDMPIDYHVENMRDGRTTANRRVLAYQDGKPIFEMQCTFAKSHDDYARQDAMPENISAPESLTDLLDLEYMGDRAKKAQMQMFFDNMGMEMRPVDPDQLFHKKGAPQAKCNFYFRLPSAKHFDAGRVQQALIGYMSDFWLGGVILLEKNPPHSHQVEMASMNHMMWFHNSARADDWLLVEASSPWTGHGRGLASAKLFRPDGVMVANYTQELRVRTFSV